MVYYLLGVASCSKRVVAGNEEATSYTSSKLYYEPPIPPHANYISFAMSCASTDACTYNINVCRTHMLRCCNHASSQLHVHALIWSHHVVGMSPRASERPAPAHLCRAQLCVACRSRRLSQRGSRQWICTLYHTIVVK